MKLCEYLTVHWGLMNNPRVDTKIFRVHGGHRREIKLQGTKIVNILQLGCNACQVLPWAIRSKIFNYMKFIQCFVLEIEVKITKGH